MKAAQETSGFWPGICLPEQWNPKQLVVAVSDYLHDNPQEHNSPAVLLIVDALTAALPCKENTP